MGNGVRQGLNFSGVLKDNGPRASLNEQGDIVNYLNDKCEQINKIISKKRENSYTEFIQEVPNLWMYNGTDTCSWKLSKIEKKDLQCKYSSRFAGKTSLISEKEYQRFVMQYLEK